MHVDEVPSGRSALRCPYCQQVLLAKKGRVLTHHFAHDGDTCLDATRAHAFSLPFFDDLEQLPGLERGDLRLLRGMRRWRDINATSLRGRQRRSFERLIEAGLIDEVPAGQRWVNGVGSHRHSERGLLVARAIALELSLPQFAELQRALIQTRLEQLERAVVVAEFASAAIDLRLYRAQLERLDALALYLLAVRAERRALHKIGVTSRPIDERLAEVRGDLARHFDQVELEVAGLWPGRGSVELYFKRKLARYRIELGTLTEYFDFSRAAPRSTAAHTLRELARWPATTG